MRQWCILIWYKIRRTWRNSVCESSLLIASFAWQILIFSSANPQQESCPIEGPFYFNYSLSDSLCSSHTSRANSCASNHRLRFTFESCPEVPSSNKGEDDIQCFANWFEGGKHYFAAKLLNNDNEAQQYRCFVSLSNWHQIIITLTTVVLCFSILKSITFLMAL